ncbi:phage tail tape measure protein [Guyparkeria halophila]|uniref:Phage tail tape measure protein n=1 Tax=Guyparkeria halophila TaxID=47960 RepID=A0ABZ0YX45_9GAMM|nr:phage tail tape measure protein [Guyparkeria halophila]WQH16134.1 phage tail tape measure protein [Guyparkeria halophila]
MNSDLDLAIRLNLDASRGKTNLAAFENAFRRALRGMGRSSAKVDAIEKLAKDAREGKVAINALDKETAGLLKTLRQGQRAANARDILGLRDPATIRREIRSVRQAYEDLRKSGTASARELANANRRMNDQIRDLRRETNGWTDSIGRMRGELAGAIVTLGGLGYGINALYDKSAKFSESMGEVSTLLDDTSGMPALTREVRALTREYGGDVNKNAKALYDIISAGAEGSAEAMGTLDTANRLAIGGVTDVSIAADGLTSVLNAYNIKASRAGEVSDKFFTAVRQGKTTVPELAQSIGQVAPLASTAEVGLSELLSAIAALTAAGVKTPQAITGIRSAISNILKPSKQATDLAAELGIQFDAQALKARGLSGFLEDVAQATQGNTEQMSLLFGDVEGLNAALALTGNAADSFSESMGAMEDSAGATDDAVAKMMDTPARKKARFKAAVNDVLLSLGDAATSLTPLLDGLTELIGRFNELPEPVRASAATVALLLGAAVPAAIAIRSIAIAAGLATAGMRSLISPIGVWRTSATVAAGATATYNARLTTLGATAGRTGKALRSIALSKAGVAGVFGFTAIEVLRLADAMKEAAEVEEELARARERRQSERQTTMDINAGSADVERKSREQLEAMTAFERDVYQRRLQEARDYWAARRDLIAESGAKAYQMLADMKGRAPTDEELESATGEEWTGGILDSGLAAARRAREYAEANRELADLDADREDALRDHRDRVAQVRTEIRDDLKTKLDAEIKAYEDANKRVRELQNEREGIEGGFADTRRALDNFGVDPGEPEQRDLVDLDRNARTSLQEGDYDAAKQQAEQARQLIDQLARSGEGDLRQLRTYLASVEKTALEAQAGEEKKAQADVDKAIEKVQGVKEDLAWLEQISIGFDTEGATQSADQLRTALQKRLQDNPLVIPVTTSDLSGNGEKPPGYATGGELRGPGTTTSDSFLIRASDREYMIRAAAAKRLGKPLLDYLNRHGQLPRGFATGGMITRLSMPTARLPSPTSAAGGDTLYLSLPGGQQVGPVTAQPDVTRDLKRASAMFGGARR